MKFSEGNELYLILLVGLLCPIVLLHFYLEDKKNKQMSLVLNSNLELLEYAINNLDEVLYAESFINLPENLLKNPYFQNFLKNLIKLLPEHSQILFYFDLDSKNDVNLFFNFLKTNPSSLEISNYKINKKLIFQIISVIK